MAATVQHAQALLAPTFYGRLPHTINGDDPVQALRDKSNFQREAEKLFAMNPQNLSDVSKGAHTHTRHTHAHTHTHTNTHTHTDTNTQTQTQTHAIRCDK